MNKESILSFTKLLTNRAVVTRSWCMMGLNMAPDVGLIFTHIGTVCAVPGPT